MSSRVPLLRPTSSGGEAAGGAPVIVVAASSVVVHLPGVGEVVEAVVRNRHAAPPQPGVPAPPGS